MSASRAILILLFASLQPVLLIGQTNDSFTVNRPDRYRLILPRQLDTHRMIEAVTDILSQTIDELKDREFCTTCKGGYTVRLLLDSVSVANVQTSGPVEIGSIPHYMFMFDYSFYAALVVFDTASKPISMLRLISTEESLNYLEQLTTAPQNVTYRTQWVYDNRGRIVGRRAIMDARPMNINTPALDPFTILTEGFLLSICEKKIMEIRRHLKLLNPN